MSDVTAPGTASAQILSFEEQNACGDAGENYALGIASTLARASEKMNICQQGTALLVGG